MTAGPLFRSSSTTQLPCRRLQNRDVGVVEKYASVNQIKRIELHRHSLREELSRPRFLLVNPASVGPYEQNQKFACHWRCPGAASARMRRFKALNRGREFEIATECISK